LKGDCGLWGADGRVWGRVGGWAGRAGGGGLRTTTLFALKGL